MNTIKNDAFKRSFYDIILGNWQPTKIMGKPIIVVKETTGRVTTYKYKTEKDRDYDWKAFNQAISWTKTGYPLV